jgi:hypothetical protein
MVITLPLGLNLTEPVLVTAKYGGDGYVLSRAIVPVQELDPERRRGQDPGGGENQRG